MPGSISSRAAEAGEAALGRNERVEVGEKRRIARNVRISRAGRHVHELRAGVVALTTEVGEERAAESTVRAAEDITVVTAGPPGVGDAN